MMHNHYANLTFFIGLFLLFFLWIIFQEKLKGSKKTADGLSYVAVSISLSVPEISISCEARDKDWCHDTSHWNPTFYDEFFHLLDTLEFLINQLYLIFDIFPLMFSVAVFTYLHFSFFLFFLLYPAYSYWPNRGFPQTELNCVRFLCAKMSR